MGQCGTCLSGRAVNSSECYCRKDHAIHYRLSTCGQYEDGLEYYRQRRKQMVVIGP